MEKHCWIYYVFKGTERNVTTKLLVEEMSGNKNDFQNGKDGNSIMEILLKNMFTNS